jgi:hypothetical protein
MSLDLVPPPAFSAFPFERPYDIQDDLMRHLYTAIEKRQVTIIESPTGTVNELVDSLQRNFAENITRGKPSVYYVPP